MKLLEPYRICGTLALLLFPLHVASAGSATWDLNAANGDWNTAANWMPMTVPNGASDVATFGLTNINTISLSADVEVDSIVFAPGASSYTINPAGTTTPTTLTISGGGIVNNSGVVQNIVNSAMPPTADYGMVFSGQATAGTMVVITNTSNTTGANNSGTLFQESASADHATIINEGYTGKGFGLGGRLSFMGTSNAGNAMITNQPGNHQSGITSFQINSSAANSTITCNGGIAGAATGGAVYFWNSASAGTATIILNGTDYAAGTPGTVNFVASSDGSPTLIANPGAVAGGLIDLAPSNESPTARVELFGNGTLDVSGGKPSTVGSIEGDGLVFLGSNNLHTGFNGLSTTFSGVIADGGISNNPGGALTKVGSGTFEISGSNTYTGGTTVAGGSLVVNNTTGSATGTGAVDVNAGTLGGNGVITGAVTIGTGRGSGAFLAPAAGTKKQATLTIQSALSFNSGSTYTYTFKAKGNQARTDKVVAKGVTIASGASFNFSGQAQGQLRQGLTFTVISNTSASAISGTFSNLPDGAILTVGSNNFQANYEGGDGNDLTLTVQ